MTDRWTISRITAWLAKDLAAKDVSSPRLEAELLVAHALRLRRLDLFLRYDQPLGPDELATLRGLIERRRRHEPLAYLTGEREFYGRALAVDRRVLIPRPETEHVVDAVVEDLRARALETPTMLDLCTGSGCVAIACALAVPSLSVDAVDLSRDALEVAAANVARHGLEARVALHEGDLYAPVGDARFEVISANPPYIPSGEVPGLMPDVSLHEPHLALDGGADGTAVLGPLLAGALARLKPGGLLVVEVGHDQGAWAVERARGCGLVDARMIKDLAGIERVLFARAP
ncbi:MAG: peptide chain release factor N(5)-glutamine methyltransferase [Polyangiales bacterium]